MKYKNKILGFVLLSALALAASACAEKAKSPSEAYRMLYAAVKAKDMAKVKKMMTKGSLDLAQFNADRQKITLEKSLENGLVAPTLSDKIEMRDERIKDNFGAVEVYNPMDKRWEDLPFMLEDGSWKLAVGNLFSGTFKSPGEGQAEKERKASGDGMPPVMPSNVPSNMSGNLPKGANSATMPPSGESNSVEVPKEEKQKPKK